MKNGMTNPVADSADAPSAGEVTSPPASDASKKLLPWLVAVAFFMESLDTTPRVSQETGEQTIPRSNDFLS